MGGTNGGTGERVKRLAQRTAVSAERRWDAMRLRRRADQVPEHFRIVPYVGHGSPAEVLVRGRVLDNEAPGPAVAGEDTWATVRRTVSRFLTDELPGVPLRVRLGDVEVQTSTDGEGYFQVRLGAVGTPFGGPWATGEVALAAPYRGLRPSPETSAAVHVRVPGADAAFGVISDIDDTILLTGAQRALAMVKQTLTGTALTRVAFLGAPELYRALAGNGSANPVFYVSSSPWNLHDFLTEFMRIRDFPRGPLLLRDLLGSGAVRSHASHKSSRIDEVLGLHPDLSFVLIGDSGQHDPEIYAEAVRRNPERVLAVYIREVRLDPGDRRVEAVAESWDQVVPFVLAADSAAVARHAAGLGLLRADEVRVVERATAAQR